MEIESITSDSDQLWYGKENILWENSFFCPGLWKESLQLPEKLKGNLSFPGYYVIFSLYSILFLDLSTLLEVFQLQSS